MRKTFLVLMIMGLWAGGALGATINVPADQTTIEAAIGASSAGDEIIIADGTYDPVGQLTIGHALTITGASETGVIINIPAAGGYGISVAAHDVTLENFTLVAHVGNENFPIHASGTTNLPDGFDNLVLRNITIHGDHRRTGFDVNGYNHVTMSNLTSRDAYGGNGAQISGCIDVDVDNIVTSDNEWGSFAIYVSKPGQMTRGSDDVDIDGTSCSFGEGGLFNQDEAGLFNTNIAVTGYDYFVRNFNFRPDAAGYTFYQDTEANAVANALALDAIALGSFIIQISTGDMVVASGMAIQPAIDAASPGGIINVGAGHYEEQLYVNKDNLSIFGAGVGATFVDSPTDLVLFYTTSADNYPVVFVDNADGVAFSNLTLDGLGRGNTNYRFQGIGYYNSGGSLTNVDVVNIMDTPFGGAQHGNGIYCIADDASPHVFNMTDVLVDGFQKTGAVVHGDGVTATLLRVDATGEGATSVTAQNGIQISGGALADVTDCDVSGIAYTGATWTASGLLVFGPSTVAFDGCTATGCQTSVYFVDGGGSFDNGTVTSPLGDALYASSTGAKSLINPRLLPQGFDAAPGENFNKAVISVSIDGSTFTGANVVDSWGPTAFGSGGSVTFSMTNSTVSNWDWGVVVYDFDVTTLTSTVNENTITNNLTYGFYSNAATVQDANLNYWGVIDPTALIEEAASVDFSPWYGLPLGTTPMTFGTNDSIKDAIAVANSGDTINVASGIYVENGQIVVDKDLSIVGDVGVRPIVKTDTNTSASGDPRGWWLQTAGTHLVLRNLELDGAGYLVYQGIRSHGGGELDNCALRNITFNPSGPTYGGVGLAAFGTGNWDITGCTFDNMGRIGVLAFGTGLTNSSFVGNTYTGKGVGDFLDYACDISAGAVMTVTGNTITGCQGVASVDGSTSAGLLVTTFFAPGTTATINNNDINGNSTGVAVGYDETDVSIVSGTGNDFSGNIEFGVTNTSNNFVDFLGNEWGAATGPFHPILNPAGTGVEVGDYVLFDPMTGAAMAGVGISPPTTGPVACGETVTLTVSYTSDVNTPDLFLYDLVLSADAGLSLPAPPGPAGFSSLDPFGGSAQSENFLVYSNGDGTWTVTGSTVANGPAIPGSTTQDLFTVDVTTVTEGLGNVTISNLTLRDPANGTFFGTVTGATINVDCTAPAAVTGITADPKHNKVYVSWVHDGTDVANYLVYRGLWHTGVEGVSAYPEYDDITSPKPTDRPASVGDANADTEWVLAGSVAVGTNSFTDLGDPFDPDGADRGVYYYEVFTVDAATNGSPAAPANDRATNYWLGDVTGIPDPPNPPTSPNGLVESYDITVLATTFGLGHGDTGYNNVVDVGPTDDWSRVGIPTTDSVINFEDLIVFAMNFGIVTPAKAPEPISSLVELAWVRYEDGRQALRLVDGTGVKGLNISSNVRVAGVVAGELLDAQNELTFLRNVGNSLDVSVAVMGTNTGFAGTGDLFIVNVESEIDVSDLTIQVRGHDNSKLEFKIGESGGSLMPRAFALNPNYPNPFNPMTKISFSLPEAQDVRLEVYAVDGRRVATLMNETRGPGLHEVIWNGQDDTGRLVSSGMYFYRINAGPYSQVQKMTLMK